jgi:hypothetical protein
MRTKLAIIAVSALTVSAVSLGGAVTLGGNAIAKAIGDTMFGVDLTDLADLPRCDSMGPSSATATSRSLPWQGNDDRAVVALPANVHYQAGDGDQVVIQGAPEIIAHVRVHNGIVGFDCDGNFHLSKADRIDVGLPGRRTFRSFALLGTGDVRLSGLSQPDLKLSLGGSGNIQADGKTDDLNVKISGSGNVKLGDLVARRAAVRILGSGQAELAPQDSLDVNLAGSGTIYLRSEPKQIETSIHGSGHIVHPDGQIQSLPRHDLHARAEDAEIRAAVMNVIAHDGDADQSELDRAKARLKANIRAKVARELSQEEEP